MTRPDLTPEQSARMSQHFEAMNKADDIAFWGGVIKLAFIALVAAGIGLCAATIAYSAATASAAQTAACHPDCAVGPYLEMNQ